MLLAVASITAYAELAGKIRFGVSVASSAERVREDLREALLLPTSF